MTTPADYSGIITWLPTAYDQEMWVGTVGGSAHPVVNDPVRNVESVGGLIYNAASDSRRAFLKDDGTRCSLQFTQSPAFNSFDIGTAATFNNFHVNGTGTIFFWVKFTNAAASTIEAVIDNVQITTVNKGIAVYRDTNEKINLFIGKAEAGVPIVNFASADSIADTNWHRVKIKIATGTNNTSIQIDSGTVTTATLGALTTGNANTILRVGHRTGSDAYPVNADISDLVILNQVIAGADETHYNSWNPPFGGPSASTFIQQVIVS